MGMVLLNKKHPIWIELDQIPAYQAQRRRAQASLLAENNLKRTRKTHKIHFTININTPNFHRQKKLGNWNWISTAMSPLWRDAAELQCLMMTQNKPHTKISENSKNKPHKVDNLLTITILDHLWAMIENGRNNRFRQTKITWLTGLCMWNTMKWFLWLPTISRISVRVLSSTRKTSGLFT